MGEAKRKADRRKANEVLSKAMKRARFDLFALGARMSLARLMSIKLSHWSDLEERVLGLVILDTTDEDYGWILMARDKLGRFRCVDVETSLDSERLAVERVRERIAMAVTAGDFEALGDQEDETNYATDVLALPPGTKLENLHPHFRVLIDSPGRHQAGRCSARSGLGWRCRAPILSASSNSDTSTSASGRCFSGRRFASWVSM